MNCDTEAGIAQQLGNLTDFNKLLDDRRAAAKRENKLKPWVVFGRLILDEFGQALPINEGPTDPDKAPKVLEMKRFIKEHCPEERMGWSMGRAGVPKADSTCKLCGKGWTIEDWFTSRVDYNHTEEKFEYCHNTCKQNERETNNKAFFEKALTDAGYKDYLMANTANEYHGHSGCEHCLSWFVVTLPMGQLKMGWRKRVVELSWDKCKLRSRPDFHGEDVTQGFSMIHAWGMEKLVEYLKKIKECA